MNNTRLHIAAERLANLKTAIEKSLLKYGRKRGEKIPEASFSSVRQRKVDYDRVQCENRKNAGGNNHRKHMMTNL